MVNNFKELKEVYEELEKKIEIKFIHLSWETGSEPPHFHEENQLLFFFSGRGEEIIEGKKFKLSPGTFILIPEKKVHFFKPFLNKPSEILSIRFKFSNIEKNKIYSEFFKKPYLYRGGKKNIEEVKKFIPSIINGKPDTFFIFKIFNLLFENSRGGFKKRTCEYHMERIESYIEENIEKKIDIKKMSEYLGLSEVYIRKIVKMVHGVNFTRFVNIKKIEYASKLLLETKAPISKISGICGFFDFNYFSRIFKKIKGIAPSKFRKRRF